MTISTERTSDHATDLELVDLFSLDNLNELYATASHHPNGDMSHQTCAGEWLKRAGQRDWIFHSCEDEE